MMYCDVLFSRSMTFVYSQMINVNKHHNVHGVCLNKNCSDIFPFDSIAEISRSKGVGRFVQGVMRHLSLRYEYNDSLFDRELLSQVGKNNVGLLHAHFGMCGLRVWSVARKANVPLVVSFHGHDASRSLNNKSYVRAIKKMSLDPNVHLVVVSEDMKKRLEGYGISCERMHVIYYGIDVDFFDPNNVSMNHLKNSIQFLQVSNFVEKKGHVYTVKAFAKFIESAKKRKEVLEPSSVRLVLAGDGPLRKNIQDLVGHLGIGDYVNFIGAVERCEVRQLMRDSDFFVHHSVTASDGDQEGIPNVIMEAMLMELPVISTFHAGIAELVRDGEDGYLVSERDVDSYAGKMRDILRNRECLALDARNHVCKEFNSEKNTNKLCGLYENISRSMEIA